MLDGSLDIGYTWVMSRAEVFFIRKQTTASLDTLVRDNTKANREAVFCYQESTWNFTK